MAPGIDGYMLKRDQTESARLNHQHNVYVEALGYLLHPSIAKTVPPKARIADVATGTAIIARSLASEFPTAQLDGFDISPAQFPKDLPSNVDLHVHNCKEPFPKEFHGQYDVVNLRLLISAMEPPDDWEIVARNVMALLKPGGALQWVESQFSQVMLVLKEEPSATTAGVERIVQGAAHLIGMHRVAWDLRGLRTILEGVGMVNVRHEVVSSDRVPSARWHGTMDVVKGTFGALETMGDHSEEERKRIWEEAMQDVDSGAYTRWDIHSYVAFKPY